MAKIIKSGKVAIVTRGRFAGKKVVVVAAVDDGSKSAQFPHAIVAGIQREPSKVTKGMGAKKLARKNKIKPFIKVINYNHLLPTRYTFNVDSLKTVVSAESIAEPTQKSEAKKAVKKVFEERHQSGETKWFFNKLAF